LLSGYLEEDQQWMRQALELAKLAGKRGEVPVGALLVQGSRCVGQGWNQSISQCDPTAHAEVIALREAAKQLGNYRLLDTTLYVTLEPCIMCVGALLHARIKRLVFGAYDAKAGAVDSRFDILRDTRHTHFIECQGGVLKEECAGQLSDFFKPRRHRHQVR